MSKSDPGLDSSFLNRLKDLDTSEFSLNRGLCQPHPVTCTQTSPVQIAFSCGPRHVVLIRPSPSCTIMHDSYLSLYMSSKQG